MIRTLLCVALSFLSLAAGAVPVVLFDFEDASQLDRLTVNTTATISSTEPTPTAPATRPAGASRTSGPR